MMLMNKLVKRKNLSFAMNIRRLHATLKKRRFALILLNRSAPPPMTPLLTQSAPQLKNLNVLILKLRNVQVHQSSSVLQSMKLNVKKSLKVSAKLHSRHRLLKSALRLVRIFARILMRMFAMRCMRSNAALHMSRSVLMLQKPVLHTAALPRKNMFVKMSQSNLANQSLRKSAKKCPSKSVRSNQPRSASLFLRPLLASSAGTRKARNAPLSVSSTV